MSAPTTDVVETNPFLPDLSPREVDVEAEVRRAEELAESIVVDSQESAEKAAEAMREIKRKSKALEDERVSLTKPRKDAAEEIKRFFDGLRKPFDSAGDVIDGKLRTYQREREEEARERQRIEEEARAKIEAEERTKREAAEAAEREAAALAAEAEDEGDAQAAAELEAEARREAERAQVREQAIRSLPAEAPAEAPALAGFSVPKRLVVEVVDFAALPDKLPDGTPLKVVDEVALRKWAHAEAKANGGALPSLPGCKFERKAADRGTVRT